jgi:hypothetical protein
VVATGPFQTPFVPKLAENLAPEVWQAHSTGYRQPGDVPEGRRATAPTFPGSTFPSLIRTGDCDTVAE